MNRRRVIASGVCAPLAVLAANVQSGLAKVINKDIKATATTIPNSDIPEGAIRLRMESNGRYAVILVTPEPLQHSPVVNGVPVVVAQCFHEMADVFFNLEN